MNRSTLNTGTQEIIHDRTPKNDVARGIGARNNLSFLVVSYDQLARWRELRRREQRKRIAEVCEEMRRTK